MNIRMAVFEDLPKFKDMVVDLTTRQHLPFKTGGAEAVKGFMQNYIKNPEGFCFIAEEAGRVIGWCCGNIGYPTFSDEKILDISGWCVHPSTRNKGIGDALLKKAYELAKLNEIRIITVQMTTGSSEIPEVARKALTDRGFLEFSQTFYIEV